jgi:hypothetical protein
MIKRFIIAGLFMGAIFNLQAVQSKPHQVNDKTYLLMNFSKSMNVAGECQGAKVETIGKCELVSTGKWGQALQVEDVNSGLKVQLDKTLPLRTSNAIVLEAWVYLNQYPQQDAYIAEKVYASEQPALTVNPKKASFGFGLFVTPQGEIAHDYTSIFYGKRKIIKAEGFQLPLKKWVHVSIMNAGFPVSKVILYVNGKKVVDKLQEFNHRLSFAGAKEESTPGKFIVGNNSKFENGFPGLIDEVRMYRDLVDYRPPPDNSFCDPKMIRKEIKDGPPYFMPEHRPVVKVSFDEKEDISSKVKLVDGKTLPGVRGQGFIGKAVEISAPEILKGQEGCIEFWMCPIGWSNLSHKNVSIWGTKGCHFYVFNSSGNRPLALFFKNDLGKNTFFNVPVKLCPDKWDHLALTWKEFRNFWI